MSDTSLFPRRHAGFTLLELLVVIGIVVVLIGLLIPAVRRGRMQAQTATCLANLRTLSTAMIAYCHENDDAFPTPSIPIWRESDWIYWQSGYDLKQSRIYPFIGSGLSKVMLCPADDPDKHVYRNPLYPYSYSFNEYMGRSPDMRTPSLPTIRLTKVQSPVSKIMIVCESSATLDDGCWYPAKYSVYHRNLLSIRHNISAVEDVLDANGGIGVVAFADGHAACIERLDSTNPASYVAFDGQPD